MPENASTVPASSPAAQPGSAYSSQRGDRRGPGQRGRRPEVAPEEKQFDERIVHIDRVARVVKGGRRFRFRALVVVGDRKHRVGVGSAKGADVTAAVTKATEVAKKHFITVPTYKGTIPHEAEAKVSGARILIMPAAPGTGLIAGGTVRIVLEVAGISNALSKSLGSTNKTNAAYATIAALQSIATAKHWVTRSPQKSSKESVPAPAEPKVVTSEEPKQVIAKTVEKTMVKKPKSASAKGKSDEV